MKWSASVLLLLSVVHFMSVYAWRTQHPHHDHLPPQTPTYYSTYEYQTPYHHRPPPPPVAPPQPPPRPPPVTQPPNPSSSTFFSPYEPGIPPVFPALRHYFGPTSFETTQTKHLDSYNYEDKRYPPAQSPSNYYLTQQPTYREEFRPPPTYNPGPPQAPSYSQPYNSYQQPFVEEVKPHSMTPPKPQPPPQPYYHAERPHIYEPLPPPPPPVHSIPSQGSYFQSNAPPIYGGSYQHPAPPPVQRSPYDYSGMHQYRYEAVTKPQNPLLDRPPNSAYNVLDIVPTEFICHSCE